ncbi:MAG: Maf family nucleotide pyrophosphatase [Dokdonella sp.]|uniref:Maf family protein n=1 Tax=Dokdonella sp. TaxID=2291710 RepID=UPI0025B8BF5F|nr:Maf family protein [Dokdonella sp.]MBZ0223309.1 Maf family nucleotide pyrophosphatase [Dokdonella sp.]
MNQPLFLASRSPRRQELLRQLGLEFEVLDVEVAEVRAPGEAPADYVSRVAREKAGAGLVQVAAIPGALVIGADTEVILDNEVFGKPADADAAAAMLARLSGRSHQVVSALWLLSAGREEGLRHASTVSFDSLDPARIAAYVATGEPFGKAGAYAIQGRAAAFIKHLDGSHSSVMGLPLHETAALLARFGVQA